ncbi:MAG: HEAT repeat domain-containing protein [Candidatus Lokiarchaeota archaeon]|nr:HEAT repeat domain-containing protein [Candidatus Lokiarchaeota archaeon]
MSKDLQRLLKKAQSKSDSERYEAVIEIADLAERAAIQPLMAMANDSSDDVKLAVASTLGFLGERFKDATPVPTLVEMLKKAGDNNDVKLRIIEALGMIGDPKVGMLLAEEIDNHASNPDILKEVIGAIGKVKYKEAAKRIVKYLEHDEESIRLATSTALGEIGDPSVIDALFKAANDVSSEVAGNAIIAIGKVGNKSCLPRLFEMLEQEPRLPAVLEAAVNDAIKMIK